MFLRLPVLRALAAQAVAFLILAAAAPVASPRLHPGPFAWIAAQALLATLIGALLGLGRAWLLFQALLPPVLALQAIHPLPSGLYLGVLLLLALLYGGGLLTRVPLYNANRAAWAALLDLVPEEGPVRVADLGAGLGGPLVHLARHRPQGRFLGVEASPLVWILAWLRAWPFRNRCRMRLGSLWRTGLEDFDVVYAFLSPAPMPRLWDKARREMRPGALLVSHSFEVPGLHPERRIPLPGREGACLLLYRIPAR